MNAQSRVTKPENREPMFTLTPAYGRDYKSKAEILADINAGKDFQAHSYTGEVSYINKEQLLRLGMTIVNVRYAKQRKVTVVTIKP
jgi:hypothetical protein